MLFFLAGSFDASRVLQIIFDVLRRCESTSISVNGVTSDKSRTKTTCFHPCDKEIELHFMANAPHLLKNLHGHLVWQQRIWLDVETAKRHSLLCNELQYIKQVCEVCENHDLKLTPRLKMKHLSPSHHEKLYVGPAYALFDHEVASAIRLLVEQRKM